jgi:hypothetical protein
MSMVGRVGHRRDGDREPAGNPVHQPDGVAVGRNQHEMAGIGGEGVDQVDKGVVIAAIEADRGLLLAQGRPAQAAIVFAADHHATRIGEAADGLQHIEGHSPVLSCHDVVDHVRCAPFAAAFFGGLLYAWQKARF